MVGFLMSLLYDEGMRVCNPRCPTYPGVISVGATGSMVGDAVARVAGVGVVNNVGFSYVFFPPFFPAINHKCNL